MESFMGLLDLLQKDPKISVCLAILETFSSYAATPQPPFYPRARSDNSRRDFLDSS